MREWEVHYTLANEPGSSRQKRVRADSWDATELMVMFTAKVSSGDFHGTVSRFSVPLARLTSIEDLGEWRPPAEGMVRFEVDIEPEDADRLEALIRDLIGPDRYLGRRDPR